MKAISPAQQLKNNIKDQAYLNGIGNSSHSITGYSSSLLPVPEKNPEY